MPSSVLGIVFSGRHAQWLAKIAVQQDEVKPNRLLVPNGIGAFVCAVDEQVQVGALSFAGFRDCEEHHVVKAPSLLDHLDRQELLTP
ncbi:MAG: hypothetical protein ACP5RV_13075 [Thiomonas sp.]